MTLYITGVTILLSLTVFSQVVADTMPATSDAMPLLGKGTGWMKCSVKTKHWCTVVLCSL